jgi:hypothetical protein
LATPTVVVAAVQALGSAAWRDRIEAAHARSAEAIIQAVIHTGELLLEAKAALRHGAFGVMVKGLSFGERAAQFYMAIAQHPVLANPKHVSHLPAAVGTLAALARLPAEDLERAIEGGTITPATRRKDLLPLRKITTVEGGRPEPVHQQHHQHEQHQSGHNPHPEPQPQLEPDAAPPPEAPEPAATCCEHARHLDALVGAVRALVVVALKSRNKDIKTAAKVVGSLLAGIPGDGCDFSPQWKCPSCGGTFSEEELVTFRECSNDSCGTTFAAVEGNNCTECNRPFTRLLHDLCCPECGGEDECEDVPRDPEAPLR